MLQAIAGYDPDDGGSVRVKIPNYRSGLKQGIKGMRIGLLRHVWTEDVPQTGAVVQAMETAAGVLRKLGAKVEEVRVRPALQYSDVKVVLAETEIYTINYPDLARRPGDFGEDVLVRVGPTSVDRRVALAKLGEVFGELRADDRAVLSSYYGGAQSCAETACECGIPSPLVKVRLFRARRRLMRALRRRLLGLPESQREWPATFGEGFAGVA